MTTHMDQALDLSPSPLPDPSSPWILRQEVPAHISKAYAKAQEAVALRRLVDEEQPP